MQPGDALSIADCTEKIAWGKFRGMHRVHHRCSNILDRLLKDEVDQAAGYLTKLCRALHQTALDGGSWHAASRTVPVADPFERVAFAGTHQELEVIASYQEAFRRLKKGSPADDSNPKGKGKNKEKEKEAGKDAEGF